MTAFGKAKAPGKQAGAETGRVIADRPAPHQFCTIRIRIIRMAAHAGGG
jgi:hypothetical protein